MPKVSFIVGAYNCQKSVKSSLESVKSQIYRNWECIICDDCSKDGTWELLKEITKEDNRFTLIRNEQNLGLGATLNKCIEYSKGEYLARHDTDDISLPERIERQVVFLDRHPEISVVGTYAELYNEMDKIWGILKTPLNPNIKNWIKGSSVIHASVMMRKEHVLLTGGYDPTAIRVEDYDLWLRMVAKGYRIITIPEILYRIHMDKTSYNRKKFKYRLNEARIIYKALKRLGMPYRYNLLVLKPVLVGLIPTKILFLYHYRKFKNKF